MRIKIKLYYDNGTKPKIVTTGDITELEAIWAKECLFTGLHDKNGKEIYEGDILARGMVADLPYEVEWLNNGWFYSDGDMIDDTRDDVVIGNSFENPELLLNK
jgi:hypothetical protein